MGIAKPVLPPVTKRYSSVQFKENCSLIPMSQDYHHQNIFGFSSNGFERSDQRHHHIAQQIRRDKLRVTDFEPPLVAMEEEEEATGLPVYEPAGMLSEMFSFPSGNGATATELLESQILQSYRNPRGGAAAADWFPQRPHHDQIPSINADSAAAMQLFLINPQQPRSPSPAAAAPPPQTSSSTLHMLLPHGGGAAYSNATGVVEGQGLSLSLSSSLQHLDAAAKAEEMRIGEGNMLFFGSTPAQFQMKNFGGGGATAAATSYGAVNMLRNSKYAKPAQDLLEEFCSVGRSQFKKNKLRRQNNHDGNPSSAAAAAASSKENPPLSAADRLEHQRRKVKLLSMLDEVDRRYNHYCEQMQMVVNSFDMVMGFGAAAPYTTLAQKAMSRHFRCLKDAVAGQLKHSCELLGEKDGGAAGVTKGETPRLKMLDQSLRKQRAFHQMGMMEAEAWRPQRGLPERSVNILRAWLFEHFLHPYPSDADKHLLARQTGLSRNQVSNWFINARVRLWKPMVEEMYQQEAKDDSDDRDQSSGASAAHTPPPPAAEPAITPPPQNDADPSFIAINTHCFTDNPVAAAASGGGGGGAVAARPFSAMQEADQGQPENVDVGSTLIRFGTSSGDVSLTLGLRHAGNLPEKSHFSIRDFGGC